jgi:hypothetical protein
MSQRILARSLYQLMDDIIENNMYWQYKYNFNFKKIEYIIILTISIFIRTVILRTTFHSMGGFFKKLCKEVCRPFRQSSRAAGRMARKLAGKKFGAFIEKTLNAVINTVATVGASAFGGPVGVAAALAVLEASEGISDKDIFKAAILGGASAFVSILSSELLAAGGITGAVITNGIGQSAIAGAAGENPLKGMMYGGLGMGNPLLVAAVKTIAEKDIEAGLLHMVGFETAQYMQACINTQKYIDTEQDNEMYNVVDDTHCKTKEDNKIYNKINKTNKLLKKDYELHNFINEEIKPSLTETTSTYVDGIQNEIRSKFISITDDLNHSVGDLRSRIAIKANSISASVAYIVHEDTGLKLSADIYGHIGLKTDDWAMSTGMSDVYKRGISITYKTTKYTEQKIQAVTSVKTLEQYNKGACFATRTYNTIESDSVAMVHEFHTNTDCVLGAGAIATAIVCAPITITAAAGAAVGTAAISVMAQ